MKTWKSIAVALCLACCEAYGASVVKVAGKEGAWHLTFNGAPYFVKGAGGGGSMELMAKMGGNSFRTWGADNLKKNFAKARELGLTVMAGFWLGHTEHGFDYTDASALAQTEREVLEKVRAFKDDDALLCWALGNEMEMNNPTARKCGPS